MNMNEYFETKSIQGNKQKAIANGTSSALQSFCLQEPEFLQAVEQSDKTFQQCLDAVIKGVGQSISDLDVYRKAVRFYFPRADVHFHMEIDLIGEAAAESKLPITMTSRSSSMSVSLDDLLDF